MREIGELVLRCSRMQKKINAHQDGIKALVDEAKPLNEQLERLMAQEDAEKWNPGTEPSVCCSKSSEK